MMWLKDWFIIGGELGAYNPPESALRYLNGQVFGHTKFDDGKWITTSFIIAVSGSEVTTHSGSVYKLAKPDNRYMEWCRENDCHIPTPQEPIKLISR